MAGLLWLILALQAAPVFGQTIPSGSDPAPEAVPANPAPAPPEVVPVPEISARSEALRRRLRDQRDGLEADEVAASIEEGLPEIRQAIDERVTVARGYLDAGAGLSLLTDLQNEWEGQRQRLLGWTSQLTRRAEQLASDLEELDAVRETWERSLAGAREAGAPPEVIKTVRKNLAELAQTREEVAAASDRVLRVQSQVGTQQAKVAEVLDRAARGRVQAREQLLQPDAPPLWKALAGGREVTALPLRVRESLSTDAREMAGYQGDFAALAAPVIAFFALMAGAAFWLRNRLRLRTGSDEIQGSSQVFDRPWSVALLGAGFFGLVSLQYAPSLALHVIGTLLIVPVVRLVMPVVNPFYHGLLFAIVGFYLTDRVRDVVDSVHLLERLIFFVETLVMSVLMVRLLRPARLAMLPSDVRPPAFLGVAVKIGLAVFVTATLANLVGFVGFSRVLGDGMLASIYSGLAAFASYRVATTAVVVLLGSRRIQGYASVQRGGADIVRWTKRLLAAAAASWWAYRSLQGFAAWDSVSGGLDTLLFTPLPVGNVEIELGNVVFFFLTVVASFLISRAIRFILQEDVFPRMQMRQGISNASATIVSYVVLLAGFLLSVAAAGIDLSAFAFVAGAFGVGIGFGLQNIVNNFISGLILLFERPIQVGDTVRVGAMMGKMTRIGIRSSTLRTWAGSEVILPNAMLISDVVTNYTLSDARRRIDVPVGIAYGTDHETVSKLLIDATKDCEGALRDPEPSVLFLGFGDSSLDFEVRVWVNSDEFLSTKNRLVSQIYQALGDAGIEIPFPQRDVHVRGLSSGVFEARRSGGGGHAEAEASSEGPGDRAGVGDG